MIRYLKENKMEDLCNDTKLEAINALNEVCESDTECKWISVHCLGIVPTVSYYSEEKV